MSLRRGARTVELAVLIGFALPACVLALPLDARAQAADKTQPAERAPAERAPAAKAPAAPKSLPLPGTGLPRSGPPTLGSAPRSLEAAPGMDQAIQADSDPVVASVDGHLIHLSELGRASQTLPESLRNLPFESLYPVLLDRMVDHEALVMMARRHGLEDNPAVKQEINAAIERILEGAYLGRVALPKVTEDGIRARYNRDFANRPATEEVRARHILLTTEAEAKDVLAQLKKGADFATLARTLSKDPDGQRGGDLGFFRREQVWPTFADMAFSLAPGQVGPTPIHNEFGWHVIKVEERRLVAPPSFSDMHDTIRQQLTAEAVQEAIKDARGELVIHRFNLDGSEIETGPKLGTAIDQH